MSFDNCQQLKTEILIIQYKFVATQISDALSGATLTRKHAQSILSFHSYRSEVHNKNIRLKKLPVMAHESEMIRTASSVGKGNKSVPRGKMGDYLGEYHLQLFSFMLNMASLISDPRRHFTTIICWLKLCLL